jgi:hypothetical protein
MKKMLISLAMLLATFILFENNANAQTKAQPENLLRHIVIITFKPGTAADSIQALDNVYRSLSKSPFAKDFEMGVNISSRDTSDIKHVYVTTFASKEDMKSYQKIPEYSSLFKISLLIAGDVSVVDYWAEK